MSLCLYIIVNLLVQTSYDVICQSDLYPQIVTGYEGLALYVVHVIVSIKANKAVQHTPLVSEERA